MFFMFKDSENNEGVASIVFNDKNISLSVKTETVKSDLNVGNVEISFNINEKSDKEFVQYVIDKNIIESWLTGETYYKNLIQQGYEIEYYSRGANNYGSIYRIKHTDIFLGSLDYNTAICCVSVPAKLIEPNKIGDKKERFVENNYIYEPIIARGYVGDDYVVLDEDTVIKDDTRMCITSVDNDNEIFHSFISIIEFLEGNKTNGLT